MAQPSMVNLAGACFIRVDAGPRYWDDARLNGVADTEGQIPFRNGERWLPIIDLRTGAVLDWPSGITAVIHYKVCDDGEYWLLNGQRQRMAKWKGYYVPDAILCVGSRGYGDYIIFQVGPDGLIAGWRPPSLDADQWAPV